MRSVVPLALVLSLATAAAAAAQPISPEPPPAAVLVAGGPAQQLDPHVDGDRIVWTEETGGTAVVRWADAPTFAPLAFPTVAGAFDFLPDVQGGRVIFTRVTHESAIMVGTPGGEPQRITPAPANARDAAIGGDVVAFQDFTVTGDPLRPELRVHEQGTGIATTLAPGSGMLNRQASVAPDGSAVAWSRCATDGTGCDVMVARRQGPGSWAVERVTGPEGDEMSPSLDGEWLVYRRRTGSSLADSVNRIHARPLAGGAERTLDLPGTAVGPDVRAGMVSLQYRGPDAAQFDVLTWDLRDDEVRRITDTPQNESLTDVDVTDNQVRIVWTRFDDNDDVHTTAFEREPPAGPVLAASVLPPVDPDGSSTFRASRGVVPLKFALARDGEATCDLPPATLRVVRQTTGGDELVDAGLWSTKADGTNFRIDDCQYHYNLRAAPLGAGRYRAEVLVDGQVIGSATFTLR